MKRLPNVTAVIEQVKAKAETCRAEMLQKQAAESMPSFSVPLAAQMYKLAREIRSTDLNTVTMDDVREFANQLMVRS